MNKPQDSDFPQENSGNFLDIDTGNDFLHMTLKAQIIEAKTDKWDYIRP